MPAISGEIQKMMFPQAEQYVRHVFSGLAGVPTIIPSGHHVADETFPVFLVGE